jgi:UDP-N-acetylmuramoyl-L-alanyl-D-glutamate--2,6-diaminopimelate ligase
MKLSELLAALPGAQIQGDLDLEVSGITADSRQAGPDTLFVAVRGTTGDGHDYLADVAGRGCRAVVVEELPSSGFGSVTRVQDTRPAPALLARRLAGNPDQVLLAAAVTGTNGKTTVSYLMQGLLNQLRGPCGLMGTIKYEDGKRSKPAPLTTPGGTVFFSWLGAMRDNGCRSVAMELSSHALDQQRTAGLELDVAVMTNLGRDHLDYHQDLAAYLQAKARIIGHLDRGMEKGPGTLVLNADDPQLMGLDSGGAPLLTFSARPETPAEADLKVTGADLGLQGTALELDWRGQQLRLHSPLVGRYNVENLCAALAGGLALGFEPTECLAALAGLEQVPGRMERIDLPAGALAVVDYAHTPDALEAVLAACDELVAGRLLVVFGCGGDRDTGKRPLMGEVAARCSDGTWITSDNPRSEDPATICTQIAAGYEEARNTRSLTCSVLEDRSRAIEAALAAAETGDIVVVAGKGHEDYQLVGDQVLHLDDREIIHHWVAGQSRESD